MTEDFECVSITYLINKMIYVRSMLFLLNFEIAFVELFVCPSECFYSAVIYPIYLLFVLAILLLTCHPSNSLISASEKPYILYELGS